MHPDNEEVEERLRVLGWKIKEYWSKQGIYWLEPTFVHGFGDGGHHMSLMRTITYDEEEGYIPWTGLMSNAAMVVHEVIDHYLLYPVQKMMRHMDGHWTYGIARTILNAAWGLNCRFPAKDVLQYCIWWIRDGAYKKIKAENMEALLVKMEKRKEMDAANKRANWNTVAHILGLACSVFNYYYYGDWFWAVFAVLNCVFISLHLKQVR